MLTCHVVLIGHFCFVPSAHTSDRTCVVSALIGVKDEQACLSRVEGGGTGVFEGSKGS